MRRPGEFHDPTLDAHQRERLFAANGGRSHELRATLVVPVHADGAAVAFLQLDSFHAEDAFDSEASALARVFAGYASALAVRHQRQRALEHLAYHDPLTGLANRALACLREPVTVGEHEVHPRGSVGIAHYPRDAEGATELVRCADVAMYHAKRQEHANVARFDPSMDARNREHLALEEELRRALAHGELVLHYQPRVELASGRVSALEALARWPHPTRGLVPPDVFIPIAEQTGLIHAIGRLALADAMGALERAHVLGLERLRVGVNLSPTELARSSLLSEVRALLPERLPAGRALEIEVTEQAAFDELASASATLAGLRALGVRVALDDFGQGFSSLAHLRQLPIDVLKIDRAFVRGLPSDAADAALVRAVVQVATALRVRVVAEGVETREQADALRALGVHEGQGYYFARPLPLEEALAFASAQETSSGAHE